MPTDIIEKIEINLKVLDTVNDNRSIIGSTEACTMHSLAWDDPEDKKNAHNVIRASTPSQVIDLPKPPDHIILDINPIKGIKWPCHLNLLPNLNLI